MAQENVKPFLEQVAAYLLHRASGPLEEQVLVVPSRRAGRFLQRYIGLQAGTRVWSPRILTMDELIQEVLPVPIADPIASYFDLYKVYSAVLGSDAESFEGFVKWGRTLLRDLDEVDRYMIPPEKLFSDLRKIKEIENWSFNSQNLSERQEDYLDLWMKLGKVHDGIKEEMRGKGRELKGNAYRRLGEDPSIAEGLTHKGKFHFIGLNALSHAEESLVRHLVHANRAELHFDADPYYLEDPDQEAGLFLRRYRKSGWGKEGFAYRSGPLSGAGRKVHIYSVSGDIGQAKAAGRILEKEGAASGSIHSAVVLADESLLSPVLHSIPSSVGELNVTMGYPLDRSILHSFFTELLQAHRHFHRFVQDGIGKGFYHQDLIRVLEHPYMDALFQDRIGVSSRKLVERIRGGNIVFLDPERIHGILNEITSEGQVPEELLRFFRPFEKLPDEAISLQDHALTMFREALKERGSALDREDLYEYSRVIRRVRDLMEGAGFINSIEAYQRILSQVVAEEELSFTGEPLQGVQIMGMLETRALDLPHIVLLSANESILPRAQNEASLIPQDLRVHHKLPTREEKDAVYAYHFHRMIQRADKVDLLYDSDPEGPGSGEKSRFLTQLLHEGPEKDHGMRIEQEAVHVPVPDRDPEPLEIPRTEGIMERLREWAANGVSPTALSTWVEDPYQFYRKYILRLPEPEELSESIDARDLGTVIHESLHELYHPYEGKLLPSSAIDGIQKEAPGVVRKHFGAHYAEKEMATGKNQIMLRVVEERVKEFLRLERKMIQGLEAKGEELRIEQLEKKLESKKELELEGDKFQVKYLGTADRIDRIGGQVRIIDLKTGQVQPGNLKIDEPGELFSEPNSKYALQLFFYGMLYADAVGVDELDRIQPSIIGFRDLKQGAMGLGKKKKGDPFRFSEQLPAFEEALSQAMASIMDPNEPIRERVEEAQ